MTNKIEILRELIQTARTTLNAFTTIGVSSVAFDYNKVISSEVLQEYERALSIEIPIEYKEFLLSIGNGGAGPLEGVFSLQSALERFNPNVECILEDCLSQDMKALSKYEDESYEEIFNQLRSCVLPIAYDEFVNVECGIILNGKFKGSMIYYDLYDGEVNIVDTNFLDWLIGYYQHLIDGKSVMWYTYGKEMQ